MRVHVVYEGHSDLPFVERLVTYAGGEICGRYNKKGAKTLIEISTLISGCVEVSWRRVAGRARFG